MLSGCWAELYYKLINGNCNLTAGVENNNFSIKANSGNWQLGDGGGVGVKR
jgi:hypothetical protein